MNSLFTRFAFLFFFILASFNSSLWGQTGSSEIYKDIKKLGVLANVLYVAAHPDDENTRLISYFSNHLSAHTTYLSLTRGDGGQNLIGPEIREMLGVIRTQELLSARAIDGGNQMFTRANDFGYSKTASETFTIWDRNDVLSDVVWAMRTVKPDVIINRFNTDTSRPNHGHHTASAILSVEAFDLAADRNAFPEQLKYVETWQPERIFFNTSWWFYGSRENFDLADKSRMLSIDIGSFDQVTGESNSEIAGRSRSMHKSQGFGSAETRGESLDYLDLIKDTKGTIPKDIFDGIDITWTRIQGGAPIGTKVKQLESSFDFKSPSSSIPLLLDIYKSIQLLPDSFWKKIKAEECESLIKKCLGLFIEVRTNKFRVSPGMILPATLEITNRSNLDVMLSSIRFSAGDTTYSFQAPLKYNQVVTNEMKIPVPEHLSTPYWLVQQPKEGMYSVPDQQERGRPYNPPEITAKISLMISGSPVQFKVPVIYKTVDPAIGEIHRPLSITPPVTVQFDEDVLVFSLGNERKINVTLTAIQDSVSGTLQLKIPQKDWKISPASLPWSFLRSGETAVLTCTIIPPSTESSATISPEILSGDQTYHHKVTTLDYDHLPYLSIVRDASVKLKSIDLKIIPRPIAYIEGAGDDVVEGLQQIGYTIDVIDPASISSTILSKYQVVILGIRAFNTIEALAYKNKILFDWVEKGGTMIVQYNTSHALFTNEIAPYPLTLSRDRVTEENSPVTMINPDMDVFKFPNTIIPSDFEGWAQERGLYFPNKWDDQFTPLLEMKDTGENPTKGSLLIAGYGNGYYVYSGLSWFRHLPVGVPGAYRLMSNLISLGYKNGKS
ncbi:MAG TPA: PIG-L family deacetylase [Saprospiraceae bacterium]|nr:PIG-L family deacetylase [Saprospiraceae bacterium]